MVLTSSLSSLPIRCSNDPNRVHFRTLAALGTRTKMRARTQSLQKIAGNSFDLCVIGGGATGAGCALDAQLRGLKTVLVDGGDFASAASSASTKLVHGGVR